MQNNKPFAAALLALICTFLPVAGLAGTPAKSAKNPASATAAAMPTADSAWKLYTSRQYPAAADAYEVLLRSTPPDPRLFYCAGLANREARRYPRAKQLFDYVQTNFATSAEAECCKTALQAMSPATPATPTTSASASIPKVAIDKNDPVIDSGKVRKPGAYVFTAEEIAREGANGIDQTNAPNCWFESSMSALAALPKGQRLLASMIRYGRGDSYIVRFPGDGVEYSMTEADLDRAGVSNHALWASLLDYAERLKFPENKGAEGVYSDQNRLEVGMHSITGCKAETLINSRSGADEILSFVSGAVRSNNPVVAGTGRISGEQLAIESHAYTVIGVDQAKNMLILRNPHGRRSRRFSLASDPQHLHFEQLEDGAFKMDVPTFQSQFYMVCRSFI